MKTFDAKEVAGLFAERERTALAHLDALEAALADGRPTLVPPAYGAADVVWTAFLARLRFIRRGAEIARRPALARYAAAMFARPSTKTADLWLSIDPIRLVKQMPLSPRDGDSHMKTGRCGRIWRWSPDSIPRPFPSSRLHVSSPGRHFALQTPTPVPASAGSWVLQTPEPQSPSSQQ